MEEDDLIGEQMTCSICLDIYSDPHFLVNCFHTFCKQCIERVALKNGTVKCPECREFNGIDSIKKDFKSQRILDAYSKQKALNLGRSLSTQQSMMLCSICHEVTSSEGGKECHPCGKSLCKTCLISHVCSQIRPMLDMSPLLTYSYSKTRCIKLDYTPRGFCVVNNEIWCSAWNKGIYMYNHDVRQVNAIWTNEMQEVVSLAQAHTGHVIAACSRGNGLHQLSFSGNYEKQIAEGSFSSVCFYMHELYALEHYNHQVLVFICSNNNWYKIKEFNLNYKNGNHGDRLKVTGNGIYISSRNSHCITIYDLEGNLKDSIGEHGSHFLYEFTYPHLCHVDEVGNLLIADNGNHRLAMKVDSVKKDQQPSTNWHNVEVVPDKEMGWPVDVLVNDDGTNMWFLQNQPDQILKLVKT